MLFQKCGIEPKKIDHHSKVGNFPVTYLEMISKLPENLDIFSCKYYY
jgi:hypothetical protein